MTDDWSHPEIVRAIKALTAEVQQLRQDLRDQGAQYVPRETWDIALGSIRVEIGRLDTTTADLDRRLDAQAEESGRRFRAAVGIAVAAFVAPIVVGVVVALLTAGIRP